MTCAKTRTDRESCTNRAVSLLGGICIWNRTPIDPYVKILRCLLQCIAAWLTKASHVAVCGNYAPYARHLRAHTDRYKLTRCLLRMLWLSVCRLLSCHSGLLAVMFNDHLYSLRPVSRVMVITVAFNCVLCCATRRTSSADKTSALSIRQWLSLGSK